MSLTFWKSVFISPAVLFISLLLSTGAMAAPKSDDASVPALAKSNPNSLILNKVSGAKPAQIAVTEATKIAQAQPNNPDVAADVKPGDWQYTALQGIATKYGCNANLNNRAVSQVEFARGLSNCLEKVEPLLAQQPTMGAPTAPTAPAVTMADLETIKRLTQEFRAQLTEVDTRIGNTEKRLAQAQANQFSTTTKLKGEAVFNLTGVASGANQSNIILGDRVRLLFQSSFTGKDILWTRLATGNQPSLGATFRTPSSTGAQVIETGGSNAIGVDWLAYQFPVYNTNVYVAAYNGLQADYAPTFSPLDDFTGAGVSLSSFGESSPIYKIGGGTGVGATIPVADTGLASVSLGYFAFNANFPARGSLAPTVTAANPSINPGLFGTDNSLLAQLNFKLGPQLDAGLTYINSSHSGVPIFGGAGVQVGSQLANDTSATGRTTANSFGAEFTYKASDKLAFNGFAMTTNANKGGALGTQNIWSYGAGIAFPDVDGKGSLAGLFVGAEPYVSGIGDTPLHFEGFYKYKLSDNLAITPGLIYVTSPNQSGDAALIGVVRTTFTF
jgi:Carbohydrate-selective porin, OprB family